MSADVKSAGLLASPAGSAYLLCFGEPGLRVTSNRYARHYIGHTLDAGLVNGSRHGAIEAAAWLSGLAAAVPIVRAARGAGLTITLERVWPGVDAAYAARLRAGKRSPRLCPSCRQRAADALSEKAAS